MIIPGLPQHSSRRMSTSNLSKSSKTMSHTDLILTTWLKASTKGRWFRMQSFRSVIILVRFAKTIPLTPINLHGLSPANACIIPVTSEKKRGFGLRPKTRGKHVFPTLQSRSIKMRAPILYLANGWMNSKMFIINKRPWKTSSFLIICKAC